MAKSKREGKLTQKEMVKAALDEKGWGTGPTELQAAIKEKYNVDMPTNYISNYKSQLKGAGNKGGGKRARKTGPAFTDLETVRGLVSRLGADQVKQLVEMADMFS